MTNHWIGLAKIRKGKRDGDYFSCTDRYSVDLKFVRPN